MPIKSLSPSIEETAFDCPHCGAYTTQTWFDLYASERPDSSRVPGALDSDIVERIRADKTIPVENKHKLMEYFQRVLTGKVFLDADESGKYLRAEVANLKLSKCFSCGEYAVWVHEAVLFPAVAQGPQPNSDLPKEVLQDYEEASRILALSPRGAAALLRLAIQKLCVALGEKGKTLDDDIANLVRKGLSPVVQQSLDSVRVIGNEAVHPGTLDLKDDIGTATSLFKAVNIIGEQMISNPKHAKELYEKLPEGKKKAITERDGKA